MSRRPLRAAAITFAALLTFPVCADDAPEVDFGRDIAPLLIQHCGACHDEEAAEGSYSVESLERLLAAGDSGIPPVVAGKPHESELVRRLKSDDDSERMPADAPPLPAETIALFERWVEQGAASASPANTPLSQFAAAAMPSFEIPEHYPRAIPIAAVAIFPGGQRLATAGYGEVLIWDVASQNLISRVRLAGRRIADLEVAGEGGGEAGEGDGAGTLLVVASGEAGQSGVVEAFSGSESADGGQWQRRWAVGGSDLANDVAVSPDGARTLIGLSSGAILLVDSGDGAERFKLDSHAAAVTAVAWSGDGEKIYSASRDRMAKAYRAADGEILASFADHERVVGGVVESKQGAVTIDETGQLRNWSADINARQVSHWGNLEQSVRKLERAGESIFVPSGDAIRRFAVVVEEVDDGKDDEGKPKKKKRPRFQEGDRLPLGDAVPLSFDARSEGESVFVAVGLRSGEVILWDAAEPQKPKARFVAKP